MNFASLTHKWGSARPDASAVALGGATVRTWRQLSQRVARLGGGLLSSGLKRGDRVVLMMKNDPHYLECMLACWHAGLAAVPVNARLHPAEVAHICEQSGARLALASPALSNALPATMERVIEVPSADYTRLCDSAPMKMVLTAPEELAWLFYTSGTTGRPKGAMITHRNLIFACHCYALDIDVAPPWRSILHPAPFSHGSGLYGLANLMKGAAQVFPESGGFDSAEIADLLKAWPNSVFFAAPTMVNRFRDMAPDFDPTLLKAIIFGGAPMLVEDIKAYLNRFGPRLAQLYGQGESPMTITGMSVADFAASDHPQFEHRIGSAGLPQSGVEVRIVDGDGNDVGTGDVGEVICRSDCVVPGYWQNPQATATAFRDGWLWTGDMGWLDEDGFLTLSDRSRDMVISGGQNIYPREVEEVLARSPDVAEVSVIGRPDAEWGEVVVAYVVAAPGKEPQEADLDALCLSAIARFKRPKAYRFVAELPKNNYGKILKTRLRELEAQR